MCGGECVCGGHARGGGALQPPNDPPIHTHAHTHAHLHECTGISSMAPADALLTMALSGAELRRQVSTPSTPRK